MDQRHADRSKCRCQGPVQDKMWGVEPPWKVRRKGFYCRSLPPMRARVTLKLHDSLHLSTWVCSLLSKSHSCSNHCGE